LLVRKSLFSLSLYSSKDDIFCDSLYKPYEWERDAVDKYETLFRRRRRLWVWWRCGRGHRAFRFLDKHDSLSIHSLQSLHYKWRWEYWHWCS
jgi:hypothetical protein